MKSAALFSISLLFATAAGAQVPSILGKDWTLRNPLPTTEHLNSIAVNPSNRAVIVGERATILTSDDLKSWTVRTSLATAHLKDVAWVGDHFVAVGENGTVLLSSIGNFWTKQNSQVTDSINSVTFADGILFAVGGTTKGLVLTSTSGGTSWTNVAIPASTGLKSIAAANGHYVAVMNGYALTSIDGFRWTKRVLPCAAPISIRATSDGKFVVSGSATCTSSDGGVHWTVRTTAPKGMSLSVDSAGSLTGVTAKGEIWSSADGFTWTSVQAAQSFSLRRGMLAGSNYVAVGQSGVIQVGNPTSTPAVPMAMVPSARPMVPTNGVSWNRSLTSPIYVAVGSGATWTSTDNVTWTPHTQTGKNMLAITWTGTSFVAVGDAIWTSTDGITWAQRQSGPSKSGPGLYGVAYINSKAYAFGFNTKTKTPVITQSTAADGYSWSSYSTLPGTDSLISMTASNGLLVGVGWNGVVLTSLDGKKWTSRHAALVDGDYFTDVTSNVAGTFVATTYNGDIWASRNGITWSKRFYASHSLWCVMRSANEFLAAGNYGVLVHSFDGFYWHEENLGTSTFINQIALAGNQLVAVGGFGAVFSSTGSLPVQPALNFATTTSTIIEGDVGLVVTVELSSAWMLPVTVPLTVGGTAGAGEFAKLPTSLTFAPGETQKSITINSIQDSIAEPDETIVVSLGIPTGDVALGATQQHTVTITNDDVAPTFTLHPTSTFVPLGASVTLRSSAEAKGDVKYQWKKGKTILFTASYSALGLSPAKLSDAGTYNVVASNAAGIDTSDTASVTVVDVAPRTIMARSGAPVVITVAAQSDETLSYQWMSNGQPLQDGFGISGATTNTLILSPAVAGVYECQVNWGSTSVTAGPMTVVISPLPAGVPEIANFVLPSTRVSAQFSFVPVASNSPTRWAAQGLPAGLVCNANTGVISGMAITPGSYTVKLTATNALGTSLPAASPLQVKVLPPEVAGSFVALLPRNGPMNKDLGARLDLTVIGNGSLTGRVTVGSSVRAFIGKLDGGQSPVLATVYAGDLIITFTIDETTSALDGTVTNGTDTTSFTGWKQAPKGPEITGSYTFALSPAVGSPSTSPTGHGYGTMLVVPGGVAAMAGRLADGSAWATTAAVGPASDAIIYFPLSAATGSIHGVVQIVEDAGSNFINNAITGSPTWFKAPSVSDVERSYAGGIPVMSLVADGGRYSPPDQLQIIMNLDFQPNNLQATFSGASLATAQLSPNAVFSVDTSPTANAALPNEAGTTLSFNTTSGTFSGGFTLNDAGVIRPAGFAGVVIRPAGHLPMIGKGFFTLPTLPDPMTSSLESGAVLLEPKP